mmetsp:Transcript_7847/g.9733  ORF Transcript_7847/g.9733 Transcript_7847/m.9733 type:complete len:337 (-) Transcript_7847:36-1046(-)
MSHASGIPVAKSLDVSFGEAREAGNVRFIKVQIVNDEMVQTAAVNVQGNAEEDFPKLQDHLQRDMPCYLLYRLDSKNDHGYEWLLISFVPDGSPVKSRMLYASSHALLKRELGLTYFSDEIHGSEASDITWELYQQHDRKKGVSDAPLTQSEVSRNAAATMEIDMGHTREYVHSVLFPMSMDAVSALKNLANNNVVQLHVDSEKETIELLSAFSAGSVQAVADKLPTDNPCFVFFEYEHEHQGETVRPIVFIYSCPQSAKVKAKMLHSTVKSAAIEAAGGQGVKVEKKIEVSEQSDLNESDLLLELHPPTREVEVKGNFNRPSRPGRGRPRMTRRR